MPNGPESQPGVEEVVAEKEEEGSEDEWEQVGPRNKTSITRQADFVRTPITDIFGGHIRYVAMLFFFLQKIPVILFLLFLVNNSAFWNSCKSLLSVHHGLVMHLPRLRFCPLFPNGSAIGQTQLFSNRHHSPSEYQPPWLDCGQKSRQQDTRHPFTNKGFNFQTNRKVKNLCGCSLTKYVL